MSSTLVLHQVLLGGKSLGCIALSAGGRGGAVMGHQVWMRCSANGTFWKERAEAV